MTYQILPIKDHAKQGLAKLLEQFKNKAVLAAWLKSYLNRIQEFEDACNEVINIRGIEASEGVNLDNLGKIVGKARLGLSDEMYRFALRAQIRINRSSGTPEDLIEVTRLTLDPSRTDLRFSYREGFPKQNLIEVWGVLTDSAVDFAQLLLSNLVHAKSGGSRVLLQYGGHPSSNCFTLSTDDTTIFDHSQGLGDDTNTDGGYLTDVLEG